MRRLSTRRGPRSRGVCGDVLDFGDTPRGTMARRDEYSVRRDCIALAAFFRNSGAPWRIDLASRGGTQ